MLGIKEIITEAIEKILELSIEWKITALCGIISIILIKPIKYWITSPKIKVYYKTCAPDIEQAENLTKSRWLRFRIKNSKIQFTSKAENCYVKLEGIEKDSQQMYPFTQ